MMPSPRVRRAPAATWREIDGQVVVLSIDVHRVRLLNRVGGFVWSRCDGRSVDELVDEVSQQYEVPLETAREDVLSFVADLESRGLVVVDR